MNQSQSTPSISETGESQDSTRLTLGSPTADRIKTGPVYVCDSRLKPGDIVSDSYEIIERLGSGGMGSVFKVRHLILQKIYAMKTLASEQVDATAWRRLQVEAQAIARMNHPNIVGIHNYGLHEERLPFYVMDLLIGEDLANKLEKTGPLRLERAISIFTEVAQGLAYAHKKGIVHRDIKPGNIILLDSPDATGAHVKLVDFGIAKLSGIKDPDKQKLTSVGEIFGSPYYMSPEQCNGARIDTRCDIYSVGCALFETLTGTPPFKGKSPVETMMMHQTNAPPTLKQASGGKSFPEALERLVAKLLEKAPMDRYQSMDKVAEDLLTIGRGEDISETLFNTSRISGTNYSAQGGKQTLKLNRDQASAQNPKDSSKFPIKLAAGLTACLALVSVIGAVTYFALSNHSQSKTTAPRPSVDLSPNLIAGVTKAPTAESAVDSSSKAPPVSKLEPFSQIIVENGRKIRRFKFPENSLGFIGPSDSKEDRVPAMGTVSFPAETKFYFFSMPYMMADLNNFRRFRPDEITYIRLCEGSLPAASGNSGDYFSLLSEIKPSDVSSVLDIIKSWTSLNHLLIERNPSVDNSIYPKLDKLKGLTALGINRCKIDGKTIGRLSYIKSLHKIDCRYCPDVSGLLTALQGSENIEVLSLAWDRGENPTTADCKHLATMKNLRQLYILNCKLSDDQVNILASLPNLEVLALHGGQFGSKCVPALAKMPALKGFHFSEGRWGSLDQIKLQSINPRLKYIKDMPIGL